MISANQSYGYLLELPHLEEETKRNRKGDKSQSKGIGPDNTIKYRLLAILRQRSLAIDLDGIFESRDVSLDLEIAPGKQT